MINPFRYGQSVEGSYFCNRTKELDDIRRHIISGQNLFIYADRRLGKTSLVCQALQNLSKNTKVESLFIDMERVTSKAQFVEVYARAIAKMIAKLDKLERIRSFFRSIIPKFEFSPEGDVAVSVEFAKNSSVIHRCLDEIMDLPQTIAKKYKKKVVVVFDEFQEVASLNGTDFEKYLRSFIQHHQDVCYIFMGSKTHIIIEMFNNPERAFYRSATVYPLTTIPALEMEAYVQSRFLESGKNISQNLASQIVKLAKQWPHYVQMLAWHVWEITPKEATTSGIEEGLEALLRAQNDLFYEWYDRATMNQRATMYALSKETEIFSQDVIMTYNLGAASTVQSAIKSLEKKGLVRKEENLYYLSDPFFAMWLSRR